MIINVDAEIKDGAQKTALSFGVAYNCKCIHIAIAI